MANFEVLTPLSNGRKKPHQPGTVITMTEEDASELVALKAIRHIPGNLAEENVDSFVDVDRLASMTVKEINELLKIHGIVLDDKNTNKASKIEALLEYQKAVLMGGQG